MNSIDGCLIVGTSSGVSGVHLKAFNQAQISHTTVRGFSNGSGVLNDGANQVNCDHCEFDANLRGWTDRSITVGGNRYDPNSITFSGNTQFQANTQWGWVQDGTPNIASQNALGSAALPGTVFFLDGTTTTAISIAADNATCALAGACRNAGGTIATFITSSAHGLTAGNFPDEVLIVGVTDTTFNGFCAVATVISATSFTCANAGTASAHSGTGTSQRITGEVFVQYGSSTSLVDAYFENSIAVNAPPCRVVIGDNNFSPSATAVIYSLFSSGGNPTSTICLGNGTAASIQNNREQGVVTNFVNGIGTATRGATIGPNSIPAVTTCFTGTDNGVDNVYYATAGGNCALTKLNAQGSTIRGYGFNALSGLNQDLAIELRSGGGNIVNFLFSDGTNKASVDSTGLGTFKGGLSLGVASFADSAAAPTISSGFGTSPSVTTNNGTAAFTVNVGTGGTASSGVIGLPTASNGWICSCQDLTTTSATVFITKQTTSATNSCTVGNFSTAAAAAAWAASDVLSCTARAR
jgi:hypothetical protein